MSIRGRLCRWLYRRKLYRLAYRVSAAHYGCMIGEDIMRGLLAGLQDSNE